MSRRVLKQDGPNYRHKEHDSLVYVTGKRYWYWNSRGRSINALDYLIQIRGYGLVDAVHTLVGGGNPTDTGLSEYNSNSPCAERTGEENIFPPPGPDGARTGKELFSLPDNAYSACSMGTEYAFFLCRFLDQTHAEIDGVKYAVQEFARRMEHNKSALPRL